MRSSQRAHLDQLGATGNDLALDGIRFLTAAAQARNWPLYLDVLDHLRLVALGQMLITTTDPNSPKEAS